jgi:mRNA interferase MazF
MTIGERFMTSHQRGDVVLIPFPFTDLTATKTRPAVVVSSQLYHQIRSELLLAYVSSQVSKANPQIDYLLTDWSAAGLPKPSFVRPKIAAIEPSLIVYHVGKLSADDLLAVEDCLRQAMDL